MLLLRGGRVARSTTVIALVVIAVSLVYAAIQLSSSDAATQQLLTLSNCREGGGIFTGCGKDFQQQRMALEMESRGGFVRATYSLVTGATVAVVVLLMGRVYRSG